MKRSITLNEKKYQISELENRIDEIKDQIRFYENLEPIVPEGFKEHNGEDTHHSVNTKEYIVALYRDGTMEARKIAERGWRWSEDNKNSRDIVGYQIIKPNFDWAGIEEGMAFRKAGRDDYTKYYFLCKDSKENYWFVYRGEGGAEIIDHNTLIRTPEYDHDTE